MPVTINSFSMSCGSHYTRPFSSHHFPVSSASLGDAKDEIADGTGMVGSSHFVWSPSVGN